MNTAEEEADELLCRVFNPNNHIHVVLPSGMVATVAPDVSEETLAALDRLAVAVIHQFHATKEQVSAMSEISQGVREKHHQAVIAEGIEAIDACGRESRLPPVLLEGLRRYLEDRIETGGFLRAILENDLHAAVARMHPTLSFADVRDLISLMTNSFPSKSYGSPEKVAAWLQEGRKTEEPHAEF